MMLSLFAGPGGIDKGADIIGLTGPRYGVDLDGDACATARAAGYHRAQADVAALDPEAFEGVEVAVVTSPCPTYSRAGKGSAVAGQDPAAVSAGLTLLGDSQAGAAPDDAYAETYGRVTDPRTALVVEALRFGLRIPGLRVLIAEQVPRVHDVWAETAAELAMVHDFQSCNVITIRSEDLGVASRRTRAVLVACRDFAPDLSDVPMGSWWSCGRFQPPTIHPVPDAVPLPAISMACALDWPAGERVNTRGNRRTSGGNEFSADGPSWCLTEKIRSWKRVSDGMRFTPAQAGLLMGFPTDYPWQGKPSKQFLQAADAVAPPVAAAVLGATLGINWRTPLSEYLADIYGGWMTPGGFQSSLFRECAA